MKFHSSITFLSSQRTRHNVPYTSTRTTTDRQSFDTVSKRRRSRRKECCKGLYSAATHLESLLNCVQVADGLPVAVAPVHGVPQYSAIKRETGHARIEPVETVAILNSTPPDHSFFVTYRTLHKCFALAFPQRGNGPSSKPAAKGGNQHLSRLLSNI